MQNALGPSGVTVDSKAKAKFFYKALTSRDLLAYMHLMYDVLLCLSKLSIQLQSPTCMVGEVYDALLAKIAILEKYKTM